MTRTTLLTHCVYDSANSRSFPEAHPLIESAVDPAADVDVVFVIGSQVQDVLATAMAHDSASAIVVELGSECLGVHTGEHRATEGNRTLGFNRFRMGDDPPSSLVELVRQPRTDARAIECASRVFGQNGLEVSVCGDHAGRILDRLLRPYFNETLRRLDEGLASADDLDLTLKLGLGYPEGPISLLERSGLHHHADITEKLFQVYGEKAFAPARRALVAQQRLQAKKHL